MADFESIIESINSKIDREVNLFNIELEAILAKVENLVIARSVASIKDPLKFDYAVQQILVEAGYYELVSEFINNSYDKNYSNITALFEASGLLATFDKTDILNISNIKALDLEFFNDIGKQASMRLKQDLFKYALSDLDTNTLVANIRESLADTSLVKYSNTYAETAISNFNQSVIDLKSQDVEGEVYIYRGVKDKKTRKFCSCLVSQRKYYDKNDASMIKSDKRRQYNCRHLIVPVGKEYAESSGYKAGAFSC